MIIGIASDHAWHLGVLSSRIHLDWTFANCGLMGVATFEQGHRYTKSKIIDTFPFPETSSERKKVMAAIAEDLDATRRAALDDSPSLTMTGLYNFVAAIRDGTLPTEQEAAAVRARAFIVAKLHDDLDLAVADAYGWGDEWRRAPLPPAEIVRRLVALNAARVAEEANGHVRWLRPDYQIPRFGG